MVDLSEFDALPCPACDCLTSCGKVTPKQTAIYHCRNCDETWKIDRDGDLVE